MSNIFYITMGVMTLVIAFMTYLAIWARRPSYARPLSLIVLVPALLLGASSISANLGYPTYCASGITIPSGKLKILGFKIIKDYRIYLLVDAGKEPVYCWIPFNASEASALQEGQSTGEGSELEGKGKGIAESFGFGHPDDPKPLTVHPNPRRPNPPKQEEETLQFGE